MTIYHVFAQRNIVGQKVIEKQTNDKKIDYSVIIGPKSHSPTHAVFPSSSDKMY